MKLRKLLKNIDYLCYIKVVHYYDEPDNDEDKDVLYEGSVLKVPWYIANMKLDTNLDYEAIGVVQENGKATIEVAVTE